jgi:subtilisin family serine protease
MYRGWNGASADHNYQWHDAIHSGGGSCGPNTNQPCDDFGHGTHTMGTMVGDDGGSNQVGMAPGAKWIGCRNMDVGVGTPTTYTECFQWFIAPTDLNDQNPNPALAPHVINNSWGCPASEGCVDPNALKTVVENTRAAGIVVVASAGNSGSSCSTVNTAIAIYDASFSVGATGSTDVIAGFSSRGPVTVDGSNRLKPDVSAPGVNVRSSVPGTGYGFSSGTSMAGPHVAGLVGLLISAVPDLAGEVDLLEAIIADTALGITTAENCGGTGGQIPNNVYGYGRIDALAAYLEATSGDPTATPTATSSPTPPGSTPTATATPRRTSTPIGVTATPTATASPTPAAGVQTHVGDLDGSSVPNGPNRWNATVTITVLDQNGAPVSGATVSGTWSNGTSGNGSCATNASGQCSITRLNIRNQSNSVTFTVTNISKAGTSYNPAANTDPDGDSNGTVIVVNKP